MQKIQLIPISDVIRMTSLGRSTIYRYISEGRFPRQVSVGEKNSAWVEEEVQEWILARIAERDSA